MTDKREAFIKCEDPGELLPLLMSAYVVKDDEVMGMAVYRASGFGKLRCRIWGLFHGYGWLPVGS